MAARVGGNSNPKEREFKKAECNGHSLDASVRTGPHHKQQEGDGEGQADCAWHPKQLSHGSHTGKFRQQGSHGCHCEADYRDPGPGRAKRFTDQLAVSFAGENTQSDGEVLHHEKDWHQKKLQQQQMISPLCAALCRSDNAADIGIGKHDNDAGAHYGQEELPALRESRTVGDRDVFHRRSQTPIIAGLGKTSFMSNNFLTRLPYLSSHNFVQLCQSFVPFVNCFHSLNCCRNILCRA